MVNQSKPLMLHCIIYKAICGAFVMFFREYHKDHHPQVVWVERGPGLTMSSRLCVFASGMFVERLPPDTCEFRLCRLSCEIAFILGTEVDLQIEAGLLSSKRSSRRAWFFVMIQGLHKPSLLFLHEEPLLHLLLLVRPLLGNRAYDLREACDAFSNCTVQLHGAVAPCTAINRW